MLAALLVLSVGNLLMNEKHVLTGAGNRRRFLATTAGLGVGVLGVQDAWSLADEKPGADRVVAGKDGTGVAKLRTFDKVRAAELLIKRLSGPEQHLHLVSVFSQEQLETLNEDQLRRVEEANLSLVAVKNEVDGTGMKK